MKTWLTLLIFVFITCSWNLLPGQIYLIKEGFEQSVPPPAGWTYSPGVTHSTSRYHDGARSVQFNSNDHYIITPLLTTPQELSFWFLRLPWGQGGGALSLQVQWQTDPNATTWNTIATLQGTNNSWENYTIDISSDPLFTTKTNIYIRLRSNSGSRLCFIDDFSVSSFAPIPDFSAVPTIAQIGQNIIFTDSSQGAITSWEWNFGAGSNPATATTLGPHSVSYSTAGYKTISLTINDEFTTTKTDYIIITLPEQSVSATYSQGDIPTDINFNSVSGSSSCPGLLTIEIPAGAIINSVSTTYAMTATNNGWMSEQRSQLRCVNPGGTNEPSLTLGYGNSEGTLVYSRSNLDIANGVSGGGSIQFELHAGRTWGWDGTGCSIYYNKVDNGTWSVTVYYSNIPNADFTASPQIAEVNETIIFTDNSTGGSFSSWLWDFGDGANPPSANTQGPHLVTYSTVGYKTISLTLDGIYTETKTDYLTITEPGDWLHWDNGLNDNAVGRTNAGILQIAARFEPADLIGYPSHEITKIRVYIYDLPSSASIKIWQGINQAGLVEYFSQNFTPVADSWVEVILNTPYQVDPTRELWFGVEFYDPGSGFYPAGIDNATEIDGKSNLFRLNNNDNLSWTSLSNNLISIDGDWNLQAWLVEFTPVNPFNPPRYLTANVENGNDVVLSWYSPAIDESFEMYNDFTLSFGNWTQYDLDGLSTYGSVSYDFTNENYTGSFIIFDPATTSPVCNDPAWQPYSGRHFAACFAAYGGPNDDWIITPKLKIADGDHLSFYHKSVEDNSGLERFKVGISTTGSNPNDFTFITPSPYLESPITWTEFAYDLSAFEDQEIYIAINCVSNDAFIFMIDDFTITDASGSTKLSGFSSNSQINLNSSADHKTNRTENQPMVLDNKMKSTRLFSSYKIYRNQAEIAQVTDFTYTDYTLAAGIYNYYVTAIYTNPTGESDSSNVVTVIIQDDWIWNGTISSEWNNTGNWNKPILPSSASTVLIPVTPNDPSITTPVTINHLSIDSGASLTIEPAGNLTVNGNLINNQGVDGLIISSSESGTGSLITSSANVEATSQRYIKGEPESWHMLSSPMVNQAIAGDFTPSGTYGDGTGYDFYTWHEPDTSWVYLLNTDFPPTWAEANGSNNFLPGRGYLVSYQAENPTLSFQGVLNSGSVTIPITKSDNAGDPFGANLIGNPYPSAIDWKSNSGWGRTDLVPSGGGYDMWMWNDTANNYGVFNSASPNEEGTLGVTRFISANQGFFVLASQNGSLSFDHSLKTHQNAGNWLKSTKMFKDIIFLTVSSDTKNGSDEVMIGMEPCETSSGTPKRFSFVPKAPSLFIPLNGQFFSAINGNNIEKNPVIPVSFKPGNNGVFKITSSFEIEFFDFVYLIDKKTGIQHNLKENPIYEFEATCNDNPARFILQLKEGYYPDPHDEIPARIFTSQKELIVDMTMISNKLSFQLLDITGRIWIQKDLAGGTEYRFNLPVHHGVCIVTLHGTQGTLQKKLAF
ncbi:MAG TPA: choice-of-anchor J domain-containing protein [Bacteroidales bacterium]|nr:choice-of-anchor J domain-containing protein [Bacteroidales bacterium]